MIKEIDRNIVFYEKRQIIELDVNGKRTKVEQYIKQDSLFDENISDWEIVGEYKLTEEEDGEVSEWMMENGNQS